MGRPSLYTQERADEICERLAEGQTLAEICRMPHMPSKVSVYRWLDAREEFRDAYARARELQQHAFADEIISIADTVAEGVKKKTMPDGSVETVTGDMVERARLRVEARKWLMARLAARTYGDKQHVEHSGNVTLEQLVLQSQKNGGTEDK